MQYSRYQSINHKKLQKPAKLEKASAFIFLLIVVWFSRVPVLPAQRFPRRHPHKLSLLPLVSPTRPEVLVTQTYALDVLLKLLLILANVKN